MHRKNNLEPKRTEANHNALQPRKEPSKFLNIKEKRSQKGPRRPRSACSKAPRAVVNLDAEASQEVHNKASFEMAPNCPPPSWIFVVCESVPGNPAFMAWWTDLGALLCFRQLVRLAFWSLRSELQRVGGPEIICCMSFQNKLQKNANSIFGIVAACLRLRGLNL